MAELTTGDALAAVEDLPVIEADIKSASVALSESAVDGVVTLTDLLPSKSFADSKTIGTAIAVDADVWGHAFYCDGSNHIDPKVVIQMAAEVSLDGGLTWMGAGSALIFGNPDAKPGDLIGFEASASYADYGLGVEMPTWGNGAIFRHSIAIMGGGVDLAPVIKVDTNAPAERGVGHHSIAYVQSTSAKSNASSALASPAGFNTASGNLMVVGTGFYKSSTQAFTSVTDNNSQTYNTDVGPVSGTGTYSGLFNSRLLSSQITSGKSGHVATLNLTLTAGCAIFLMEVSGQATSNAFDCGATVSSGDSVTTHNYAATAALSQANNLAVAVQTIFYESSASSSFTSSGWTTPQKQGGSFSFGGFFGYANIASAAAYSLVATTGSGSGDSGCIGMYKEAAAAGGAVTPNRPGSGMHPGKTPVAMARFMQSKQYARTPFSVVFRKTLSGIGSRTGSRQKHND